MRRSTATWIAFALGFVGVFCTLGGCRSTDHLVDGTDIPRVPELTLSSAHVQHERNKVSSADMTFTGPIFDALERVRWTTRGFDKDGWTNVSTSGNSSEANAVFSMPWYTPGMERVVNLHVVASETHGTATIQVSIEKVPKQASQPPKSN